MNKGWILIAEDSPEIREILNAYLSSKGYSVIEAENGSRAAELIRRHSYDLIISDINMPGMDGLELLNTAKKVLPATPFVLITGFPTMENAIQAIRRGASDYITKPFKFNQIDLLLERLIQKRKEEQRTKPQGQMLNEEIIEELNDKLNRKVQELSKLNHISESISLINDEETLFQEVVQIAAELTQAQRSYLLFRDGDSGDFFIKVAQAPEIRKVIPNKTRAAGNALMALNNHHKSILSSGEYQLVLEVGDTVSRLNTFLLIPLIVKKELFGAIVVSRIDESRTFSIDDELIVAELSRKMTLALENTILYHTLYMHVINTLQALVASVEAKDQYTERHSHRVTYMAKKVAEFIECSPSEMDSIEFAGLLHDIGKIGVPDVILTKRGPLTNEEWSEYRRHPEIGESIVKPLKLFAFEASIIRHHHERWDGKGYPDGLKGMEIPLLARIISVVDSFDAMVSSRPYRSSKPVESALEELQRYKGTQFDPDIVDAFIHTFSGEEDHEALGIAIEEHRKTDDDEFRQESIEPAPSAIMDTAKYASP